MKPVFSAAFAVIPLVIAAAAVGCGVHSDKAVAKAAIGASTEKQRDDSFEATAQLLDEKPELVDELYKTMRRHPKAMASFMKHVSVDLADEDTAKTIAGFLADNPDSVHQVMTQSILAIHEKADARAALDRALAEHAKETADILADDPKAVYAMMSQSIVAIQKKAPARVAMNKALTVHADQTSDILTDDPQAMAKVVSSLMTITEKKPSARKNLVLAIHEDRQQLVALVAEDKELSRAITAEVLKEALKDEPALQKVAAKAGMLNDPSDLAPKNAKNAQGEAHISK